MASYRLWYDLSLSNNRVRGAFIIIPRPVRCIILIRRIDVKAYFDGMKSVHDRLFEKDLIREINNKRFHDEGYDTERRLFGQKKDLSVFGSLSEDERESFARRSPGFMTSRMRQLFDENTALLKDLIDDLCEKKDQPILFYHRIGCFPEKYGSEKA